MVHESSIRSSREKSRIPYFFPPFSPEYLYVEKMNMFNYCRVIIFKGKNPTPINAPRASHISHHHTTTPPTTTAPAPDSNQPTPVALRVRDRNDRETGEPSLRRKLLLLLSVVVQPWPSDAVGWQAVIFEGKTAISIENEANNVQTIHHSQPLPLPIPSPNFKANTLCFLLSNKHVSFSYS